MNVEPLGIAGLCLVHTKVFSDTRGFFQERFRADDFQRAGIPHQFVQVNHSRSWPKVLRGIHFQRNPNQGKFVGAIRGTIWDVAVDLRPQSPTFKKWVGVELSETNGKMLWIPAGFGHGFCVLGDEPADVVYNVDALYNPKGELGISWVDPDIAIEWPIAEPIVSDRDRNLPLLASLDLVSFWSESHSLPAAA